MTFPSFLAGQNDKTELAEENLLLPLSSLNHRPSFNFRVLVGQASGTENRTENGAEHNLGHAFETKWKRGYAGTHESHGAQGDIAQGDIAYFLTAVQGARFLRDSGCAEPTRRAPGATWRPLACTGLSRLRGQGGGGGLSPLAGARAPRIAREATAAGARGTRGAAREGGVQRGRRPPRPAC